MGSTTAAPQGGGRPWRAGLHRRHRQRPDAPHAPARARQDADGRRHRRPQRHLQELRALPVDGDERACRACSHCLGSGSRRDPRRGAIAPGAGCIERMLDFVPAPRRWASAGRRATGFVRTWGRHACSTSRRRNAGTGTRAQHPRRARDIGQLRLDRPARAELTQRVRSRVIVREDAVLCGRDWFDGTVHALDAAARLDCLARGNRMAPARRCVQIRANAARCSPPSARR